MKTLPLLKVRYAQAFARALGGMGLPSARPLASVKLHERVLLNVENWIPVKQLGDFAAAAVRENCCWELGLTASMLPRKQHSSFSRKVLFTQTLYQSLWTVCKNSCMEDTSALFRLIPSSNMIWLNCGTIEGTQESVRQIELYRFGALLEVIRGTAGADWLPPILHLQSADDGRLHDVQLLRDINVRFGGPGLAIQIPSQLLSRSPQNRASVSDAASTGVIPPPMDTYLLDYDKAVKEVIRSQMGSSRIGIEDIACSVGVSTRSLQRHLAADGTSFSELLEEARIEAAQKLLAGTGISHGEISKELGYRNSTHFSRAFRRVCGMSPRQYRSNETAG